MACLDEIMRLIQCSSLRKEDDGTSILTDETLSQLRPFLSDRGLFVAPKAPFLGGNGVTEYLDILETERNAWRREKQHIFHRNFGSEFTSGTSPTLFAMTVLVRLHDVECLLCLGVDKVQCVCVCFGSAVFSATWICTQAA